MPAADPHWDPYSNDRTCYTCGAKPSGHYGDGSPLYSCSHPAVEASAAELLRWGPAPPRTYRKVKGQ